MKLDKTQRKALEDFWYDCTLKFNDSGDIDYWRQGEYVALMTSIQTQEFLEMAGLCGEAYEQKKVNEVNLKEALKYDGNYYVTHTNFSSVGYNRITEPEINEDGRITFYIESLEFYRNGGFSYALCGRYPASLEDQTWLDQDEAAKMDEIIKNIKSFEFPEMRWPPCN